MPAALQDIDWNLAQALYCQGVAVSKIAIQVSVKEDTLRARINRQNWLQLKKNAQGIVSSTLAITPLRSLASRTKSIREKLTNDVEKAVDAFCDNPKFDPKKSKSLRAIALRESVATQIQKRAWATLGLDAASASGTVVNIAVMSAASDAEQPEVLPPAAIEAIEVGKPK